MGFEPATEGLLITYMVLFQSNTGNTKYDGRLTLAQDCGDDSGPLENISHTLFLHHPQQHCFYCGSLLVPRNHPEGVPTNRHCSEDGSTESSFCSSSRDTTLHRSCWSSSALSLLRLSCPHSSLSFDSFAKHEKSKLQ